MPSINHYVRLTKHSRIRINTCEGENHVSRELQDIDTGKWSVVESVKMDDEAALAVAHKLIQVLEYV